MKLKLDNYLGYLRAWYTTLQLGSTMVDLV